MIFTFQAKSVPLAAAFISNASVGASSKTFAVKQAQIEVPVRVTPTVTGVQGFK